ncbi:MAG: hypothetical protein MMC23_004595 [Stictis urceolatum]|nr:hypothetical protein [Stictis urceolata]
MTVNQTQSQMLLLGMPLVKQAPVLTTTPNRQTDSIANTHPSIPDDKATEVKPSQTLQPPPHPTQATMSTLPDLSTLASKPAQNPSDPPPSHPLPVRSPSSTNYTAALAEARSREDDTTAPTVGTTVGGGSNARAMVGGGQSGVCKAEQEEQAEGGSETAGSGREGDSSERKEGGERQLAEEWRPKFGRQQSWSGQDYKRMSQGRLMSGEGPGFTEGREGREG